MAYKRYLIAGIILQSLCSIAVAGELDSAYSFWDATRVCLGQKNFSQYDSTTEIMVAVNMAMRDVSHDIGIIGYDTVTIVDKQFFYTLNNNFMEKGLADIPYRVIRISAEGSQISGLKPLPTEEFAVTQSGTSPEANSEIAVGYSISGNRFWMFPAGSPGDKVYIEGPIEITPHTSGGSVESVIPETDRHAVVYRAASILATSRNAVGLATFYEAAYQNCVSRRRGDYRMQRAQ